MREEELSALPFWEKLKKSQREILIKGTKHATLVKGGRVLSCNKEYGAFYIRKGNFAALLLGETDTETELFRVRREEICTLEHSFLCGQEIPDLCFQAITSVDLILIEKETFMLLYQNNPFFAEYVVHSFLNVFPVLVSAIRQRDYMSLEKRIIGVLLNESVRQRSNTILLTHGQIASKIGSAREAVTRKLHEFSENEWISCTRGKIIILNKEKLKKGRAE